MKQTEWTGTYSESWQGEIVPEAFSHPAKFSRALIRKIYQHMLEQGYIKAGDSIVDPFGGVGLGGLDAMRYGLHWYGVELEPRFVGLGQQNIELWNGRYREWFSEWGAAVLVQGDSRNLTAVLGQAGGCVSSPPFQNQIPSHDNFTAPHDTGKRMNTNFNTAYGSMPAGSFDGAVSSSPYADAVKNGEGPGVRHDHEHHNGANATKNSSAAEYGRTPGQLGGMDGAVTSAPFEASLAGGKQTGGILGQQHSGENKTAGGAFAKSLLTDYGYAPGNIGNDQGQTFWQAARVILDQLYQVLKPGAYASFVCGDFVRKGKRVYFGRQWLALCEAAGFEGVEWIIAWKTEYHGTQANVDGGHIDNQIDRVSFFRRLANNKKLANELWKILPDDARAQYLDSASHELWGNYNDTETGMVKPKYPQTITLESLAKYQQSIARYEAICKAAESNKPPTDKKIQDYAKMTAWADHDKPQLTNEIILNEDVIIVRKPVNRP